MQSDKGEIDRCADIFGSKVQILQLENALSSARHELGEMRKISYQEED